MYIYCTKTNTYVFKKGEKIMKYKFRAPFSIQVVVLIAAVGAFLSPYVACFNGLNNDCGNGHNDTLSHMAQDGITMRIFIFASTILSVCLYLIQRTVHRWISYMGKGAAQWWEWILHGMICLTPVVIMVFLMTPIGSVRIQIHAILATAMVCATQGTSNCLLSVLYYRGIQTGRLIVMLTCVEILLSVFLFALLVSDCECGLGIGFAIIESVLGFINVYINLCMYTTVAKKNAPPPSMYINDDSIVENMLQPHHGGGRMVIEI